MRVRLDGIHRVTKRLADGSVAVYYYAWRGGPRIKAEPDTDEFLTAYLRIKDAHTPPPPGQLAALLRDYEASSAFGKLTEGTQKDYRRYLALIRAEFGDMPLAVAQDKRARGVFKEWRDTMRATPRKADLAWTVLARVLAWAYDAGRITANVCEKGGRLHSADRSEKVWTEEQVMRAMRMPAHLRAAFVLALWTGQRQGDLLRLPWSAYDGRTIRLRQSKTGARVAIPASDELREMLDGMARVGPLILTTRGGRPWTSDGFRASWQTACKAVGVAGVTFHDIRGTAITRLAEAGCTEAEIASITGHSIGTVANVVGRYLARSEQLAGAAVAKLEASRRR